jgi:sugar (pentulose or hexulose) kinase
MKFLFIDIGSTWIKWTTYKKGAHSAPASTVPFPSQISSGNKALFEVKREEIDRIIFGILESCRDADTVLFAVQMHGYFLGTETGEFLTPFISWQDERAKPYVRDLSLPKAYGADVTANLPRLGVHSFKVAAPQIYEKVGRFFTLGSYVAYRLTGKNATHITDAYASGYYNVRDGLKDETPFELPDCAYVLQEIGRFGNMRVISPVGDQQASIFGCSNTDDAYILNIGTAAQICAVEKGYCEGNFESRPFFDGQMLCTVNKLIGGREIVRYNDDTAALEDILVNSYSSAIKRLPKRNRLIIIGGAVLHFPGLVDRVCARLGYPYGLLDKVGTLTGLQKLALNLQNLYS